MAWPVQVGLQTNRFDLVPLTVGHAPAMVEVLADPVLYAYTGGCPPTLADLQRRYAAQAAGRSPDGTQWWLNWVVHRSGAQAPLGFVQATVEDGATGWTAEVAWVVTPPQQGAGAATEAARAMVRWLVGQGVRRVVAHVHPDHEASRGVARKTGLRPTGVVRDGEQEWELRPDPSV